MTLLTNGGDKLTLTRAPLTAHSLTSLDDQPGSSTEGTPVHGNGNSGGRVVVHSLFEKVRKLGSGSFGTVLLAENVVTRQMFAVKVLDKERLRKKRFGLTATALERCELEVEIHKRLHHRNVVRLYTVRVASHRPTCPRPPGFPGSMLSVHYDRTASLEESAVTGLLQRARPWPDPASRCRPRSTVTYRPTAGCPRLCLPATRAPRRLSRRAPQ